MTLQYYNKYIVYLQHDNIHIMYVCYLTYNIICKLLWNICCHLVTPMKIPFSPSTVKKSNEFLTQFFQVS